MSDLFDLLAHKLPELLKQGGGTIKPERRIVSDRMRELEPELRKLIREGKSQEQIAAIYKVKQSSVSRWFLALNLKTRIRRKRQKDMVTGPRQRMYRRGYWYGSRHRAPPYSVNVNDEDFLRGFEAGSSFAREKEKVKEHETD